MATVSRDESRSARRPPDRRPALVDVRLEVGALARSVAFYRDRLGMRPIARSAGDGRERCTLAFADAAPEGATTITLEHAPARAPAPLVTSDADAYWKVGVTVSQLDRARARLLAAGVTVSAPAQFEDIGYLCHLRDPDGYAIELLQRSFEPPRSPRPPARDDDGSPLGEPGALGQITLRARDIAASRAFYERRLGMRLLSIQPVPARGFTLYFFAYTDERPPDPELRAVGNREWLWRRPYTTLELLHRHAEPPPYRLHDDQALGFRALTLAPPQPDHDGAPCRDPDGVRVLLA